MSVYEMVQQICKESFNKFMSITYDRNGSIVIIKKIDNSWFLNNLADLPVEQIHDTFKNDTLK